MTNDELLGVVGTTRRAIAPAKAAGYPGVTVTFRLADLEAILDAAAEHTFEVDQILDLTGSLAAARQFAQEVEEQACHYRDALAGLIALANGDGVDDHHWCVAESMLIEADGGSR